MFSPQLRTPIKILMTSLFIGSVYAGDQPPAFSQTGLQGWKTESFKGQTAYQIVQAGDQPVLFAHAQKTASGLGWEGEPDLQKTPRLSFTTS
ncbi:MAG: DUF3047 domain-containing protein [Marinospirillum sp.]|uniref:DUF3047 domain-containing protein n=1 Tax=Marinospirillum sp. TaxID=2183934 RepID=UPI0019EEE263|nr:DUF3047 domain-containing protein [Marinospirillum sp.]